MNGVNLKPLTEREMSQITGGRWIKIAGEWIWVSDLLIEEKEDMENGNLLNMHA